MKFGEEASKIAKGINETLRKVKRPLTDDQLMVVIGSLCIYVEKVFDEGFKEGYDQRREEDSGE